MASIVSTQYLARPHGRIGFDVQGSGPLIVLVPGMGELRSTYRFLAPALVEAGYTVATTDLRGHGDSDATFASYGDRDTADDVAALIRLLGGPAVIVGNSMGAGAAVIVAAQHPELVSGLVLIGPFVRNPPTSAFAAAMFRVLMARPWAAAAWKAYLPTLYAGAKPADFAAYRDRVAAALRRPGYARAFSLTTRTDHAPAEASLGGVKAPVLVVMGEKDPDFTSPRAEAEWIADAVGGEVVIVADAGHYPQAQQPEQTATAVIAFLERGEHRA
ncbi:alpha/beta fold hydrolase [Microbacterium rhizomatis]|uniref:Alpha/beta hydrolase n=1 Tax=Microbacterium rhizomatis TaxID=1631477 RepID=A0A5J5J232_9MICO|nr:alpha/beta hydrolase [Microbacterium rhizomatis]KAA9108064.1 alpha/beta hydrolase [Microbacterium rhizomatis]